MAGIAVIGAGMGTMAAAARLAVAGRRVTVLERGDTYGGALRRYARDGFTFDTGPGLLHLPAVYRDLFVKTGREALEECVELRRVDPDARHVFADGTAVTLPGFSHGGVRAALDEALGAGAGQRWSDLLGRARAAWDATRRPLLEEPARPGDGGPTADPYPASRRRGLLRRRPPTLAEVAEDELRDPRLTALLGGFARSYGLDPAEAPASAAVLAYLEQTFGTWYVCGGMRELARALHDRCVARGVEFRFGAEVARVREADGRATGAELTDGEVLDADAVVAPGRADAHAPGARARFTVLLALDGPRPRDEPHRTLLHGPDRLVTVLRPDDPALVPDAGHEAVVLTAVVPAGPVAEPERLADTLVAAADAAGLNLGSRVRWREVRTPLDHAASTHAPGGAVPPPVLAGGGGAWRREANLGSPRGVYRAGGWAHPGGGTAHAGMSGALAAGLLLEGDDWRGSR
ncbi:NAD(P)/FAD-dependent oxidoreductase [Streptomyces sp. RKND-216]|uniref:phytoene desaturase family protein n=1 Tax=Streptomyces sp. RKND-216 TaxID=2562581 RepID=UPI00109DC47B|nr:NAD(P)/FAD-dependent oxidoreductase [Streptomyces sp. RKND-216]THA26857.1 NAD(P)/FAD-dependent oxidoreductase [Streptomyces sp. RKND-216]